MSPSTAGMDLDYWRQWLQAGSPAQRGEIHFNAIIYPVPNFTLYRDIKASCGSSFASLHSRLTGSEDDSPEQLAALKLGQHMFTVVVFGCRRTLLGLQFSHPIGRFLEPGLQLIFKRLTLR